MSPTTNDAVSIVVAIGPAALAKRLPNSKSSAAPKSGNAGISHAFWTHPDTCVTERSSPQCSNVVHVGSPAPAEQRNDDPEPPHRFGSRYDDHEERQHLT